MSRKSKKLQQYAAQTAVKTASKPANTTPLVQGYGALTVRQLASYWTPALLETAQKNASNGNYTELGGIVEWIRADVRVRGCLESRISGLTSCEKVYTPIGEVGSPTDYTAQLKEDLPEMLSSSVVSDILTIGLLAGFAVAQLTWKNADRLDGSIRSLASINVFHPSNLVMKDSQLIATDRDNVQHIVDPSKYGEWLVFYPFGVERAYSKGYWRVLSFLTLAKYYGNTDLLRYSEKHGQGIVAATVEKDAIDNLGADNINSARAELVNFFKNMGREKGIALPPGFDIKLIESSADTSAVFQAILDMADKAISIALLGQNLTTDVSSGSLAASKTHSQVKQEIVDSDVNALCSCLREQVIKVWAAYNFGDPNLAPQFTYDTSEAEDLGAIVTTWRSTADAIKSWNDLGVPVDFLAAAKRVGLPVIEGKELTKSGGQVYEYHYKYGLLTVNEGRASIGLPAIAGGDKVVSEATAAPSTNLSENAVRTFSAAPEQDDPSQAYVDDLASVASKQAAPSIKSTIDQVLACINRQNPNDPNWMKSLVKDLIDEFDPSSNDELQTITERAIILANLMGLYSVIEEENAN